MSSISWSDTQTLETELNERFRNNPDYDIKNIAVYAKVTDYSYIPIETHIDNEGYIRVADSPNLIGCKLFVGSKRQFISKRVIISSDTVKVELDKDTFVTAWDPSKFVIFRNGYLLNSNNLEFAIPSFDNKYLRKFFYSTVPLLRGDKIDIYYIESDDNFSKVEVSRDMYVGAKKYLARRANERVIIIPYPNIHYNKNEQSFFVFNRKGELLDNRVDYVVSANGEYITLSEEEALAKVNRDYIVFAFPQLPNETEDMSEPDDTIPLDVGVAYFNYAYSLDQEAGDETGIIRFDANFSDYRLTKKNFILFCNGLWINPDRYDIYTNNSIQFLSEIDKITCVGKKYTMIIYNDTADHTEYQIPGNHRHFSIKYNGETSVPIPNLEANYNTLIMFNNGQIVDKNKYLFDDNSNTVELYDSYTTGDELSFFFINGLINNTDMEREFLNYHTTCGSKPQMGIPLPYNLMYKKLEEQYLLLFYDGTLLKMNQDYEIVNNKVFLNENYFIDDDDQLIDISDKSIDIVYLDSIFSAGISKVSEEEAKSYREKWNSISNDYVGGQVFRLYESKEWASKTQSGIIGFYPAFDKYQINKRNILLFGHGTWIHPDRYEIYDNGTIIFTNENDRKAAQWTHYTLLIVDDQGDDARYCPSSFLIEKVTATEDDQSIFPIPEVAKRYRSFIIFRGNQLFSKVERYKIHEDNNTIEILNDFDYLTEGRSLYFVFLDAFTRSQQETQIIQFNFDCDPSGITKLPKPLVDDEYQMNEIALFLNGRLLDQSLYTISDNKIYLSGYLLMDAQYDRYYFTVVYLITFLSEVREYTFTMPTKPEYPVSPMDNVKQAYVVDKTGYPYFNINGQVVEILDPFTDYDLEKSSVMLFKDGLFVTPSYYELYDNGHLWFSTYSPIQPDNSIFNMEIITNTFSEKYTTAYPTIMKTVKVKVEQETNIIPIPSIEDKYKSFILFINGYLIDLTKVCFGNKEIHLVYDHVNVTDDIEFVFLNGLTNEKYSMVFLMDSLQINGPTSMPTSMYNTTSYESKYMMVFKEGKLLPPSTYSVEGNTITMLNGIPCCITIVHLVTVHTADLEGYENEYRDPDTDKNGFLFANRNGNAVDGLCTFPEFDDFSIKVFNFLLFDHEGGYIYPYDYVVMNNEMLRFHDPEASGMYHMEIPYQSTLEGDTKPISLKFDIHYATENTDQIFRVNDGDEFILFINDRLIPREDYIVEDFYVRLLADTLKHRDIIVFVTMTDSYNKDRRKPTFVEYTFSNPSDSGEIAIPYYDMTKDEYSTPCYMVFVNGKYAIPELEYTISEDNKTINVINEDKFNYGDTITLLYLFSYVADEEERVEPLPEVREKHMVDDIPDDDKPTSVGLHFKLLESTRKSVDEATHSGYVEFIPPFSDYPLSKENFLLFGGSTLIDPSRYEIINNGLLHFEEDNDWVEMRKFYMLAFTNEEAIKTYGVNKYVKTDYLIKTVDVTEDNQTEFELPIPEDDYQSYIVFKNGIIIPFFDDTRYRIDDTAHRFYVLNDYDIPIKDTKYQFLFISSKTNSDMETHWSQVSFKCYGYKTAIPDDVSVYLLDSLYKDRTMLFLNGTYVHPDQYSISDGHIYHEDGNYTITPNSLYTIVYLSTNDSDEYEIHAPTQIEDTFETTVDSFIFEDRYAKPYIGIQPVIPDVETHVTKVDILRCISDGITTHGVVKFTPTFNDYDLKDENVLLFQSGYLVDPSKFTVYTDNYIYFRNEEDRESAISYNYDLLLPTDTDYYDYVAPVFKFSSIPVTEPDTTVFDIPVIEHMDNSSLLIFRKNLVGTISLFYGYGITDNTIKLNPNTTPLEVGEELLLVYFESTISKTAKKYQFTQATITASTSNNTIIPNRYLELDPDKIFLFYDGRLLRRDEFSWDAANRSLKLVDYTSLPSGTKYSIVQLEESSVLRR